MYELTCKSWDDFKSKYRKELSINGVPYDKDSFLFRGQMNSKWKVTSSFDRIEKDKSKSKRLIERLNESLKKNQHPILENPNINDDMIAAFGQHYGLPTRLIDWSISPYIAAFFAYSDALLHNFKGKHISILAINKKSEAIKRDNVGIKFIEIPNNRINFRLKSQMGQFTLSNYTHDCLEDYIDEVCANHNCDDALWKFNIPTRDIADILDDLDLMNINYESIYPDIEGFVKSSITSILR